jgi:hypothetical protein
LKRIQTTLDECSETAGKAVQANDPDKVIDCLATAHSEILDARIRMFLQP